MTSPNEYTLVEKPILDHLQTLGYHHIPPQDLPRLRPQENEVLLLPVLVDALIRINHIPRADAVAISHNLAGLSDNQKWLDRLRGEDSRKLPGETSSRNIKLIDFENPSNNTFACVNQLRVRGEVMRKPDVIVYVNGIPLVVIEAKSPTNTSQSTFDAIDQIRSAEGQIPRLFYSNLFNIATNDLTLMYGTTGSPREDWAAWRDPWPRVAGDFGDETAKGLYSLLQPERLLDILAHFIVFETRDGKTTKKMCRYQQLRAVNKMVLRVVEGDHRAGLVWHTQGSGKSLTMVFAALKLKFHRGITSPHLQNPNLLVITDRVDLHEQITGTFKACGLPYPKPVESIQHLRQVVSGDTLGLTVLSTIFKFYQDDPRLQSDVQSHRQEALREMAIPGSENWIIMVDEAHRTQEKDLGAYLRAVLPRAVRFGFTGTPVKKGDKDTFTNFGAPGETYLDKYGIDDAVADGATVPIYYQGRMTEWHLHDKEIDVVFEEWFAEEPEDHIAELKKRGVTLGDLARFERRINLIAVDIWAHFRGRVEPDGYKAQICAIDRLACVAYKKALDQVITHSLMISEKVSEEEARAKATTMSVCVYSPGQSDGQKSPDLVTYQIEPDDVTRTIIPNFKDPKHPLKFLIVCNKLLTGFDAPIEQAMYLDNPLTDHNLLQAIARTNRRYGASKDHGIIVDYIGVSKKLADALAAYRREDVESALRDEEALHDGLRAAHREVMALISAVPRTSDVKKDVMAVVAHIATEDQWYIFRAKANTFITRYVAVAPDPRVLLYQRDLKFIGAVLPYGRLHFEKVEATDWKKYSEKIRQMLEEHLDVTGLKTVCKLRNLTDPAFWEDFETKTDAKTAAVRKLAELKKETRERATKNGARYDKFSDRIKALIQKFSAGLIGAEEVLEQAEALTYEMLDEDQAHVGSGLSERAYNIAAILEKFKVSTRDHGPGSPDESRATTATEKNPRPLTPLQQVAADIDHLYGSEVTAPPWWQDKSELKKELRGQVRRMIQHLGLEGWQKQIPLEVEAFAVIHHARP